MGLKKIKSSSMLYMRKFNSKRTRNITRCVSVPEFYSSQIKKHETCTDERFAQPKSLAKYNGSLDPSPEALSKHKTFYLTSCSYANGSEFRHRLPIVSLNLTMLFLLISLNLFTSIYANINVRHKRYLVYPDGGPARTQFIIGLGVPVDLKEASVTVGTVIKFQYDLPTNSSEYTSRIYGFAQTVSRDIDDDTKHSDNDQNELTDDVPRKINDLEAEADIDDLDKNNDTLIDITFDSNRKKRSLVYSSDNSNSNGISTTTELPLEEAIRRQELIDSKYLEENEPQRMNRWDFYKIIEHMVERYGYTGKPCLLRTICEAAEVPFTHENGLLGEIGHILFTPSSTSDALSHHSDNEYHAAERLGREAGVDCESLFRECEGSVLDTFTQIGEDTLHKFGLF